METLLLEKEESTIPKTHMPYAPEFRRHLVELVRAGRDPEALAPEFEPTAQSIRNWVQADRNEGRRADGLTIDERQELVRLRRENGGSSKSGRFWQKPRLRYCARAC